MRTLTLTAISLVLVGCGASSFTQQASTPAPSSPSGSVPALLPGKPALLVEAKDSKAPLADSVFWDGTNKPASLPYTGNTQFKPILKLTFIPPNGLGLVAEYDHGSTTLPITIPEGCGDDELLKDGCYAQVGLINFDKSDNPDVVVAFGDGRLNLHVNVIRYHPPGSATDVGRDSNWELIGSFEGQSKAIITDTDIQLPIGSNGNGNKFVFAEGKFFNFDTSVATQPTQVANTPTPQAAPQPAPQPQQPQSEYTLSAGAAQCPDFKSALMMESVERTGNELAINSYMDREGCDSSSQALHITAGSTVQEVGAGVVVINTPDGTRVYTLQQDIRGN